MTMYKYNPSQPDKSDNIEAVRDAAHGYLPNELVIDEGVFVRGNSEEAKKLEEIRERLESLTKSGDYWRSFDPKTNNFHVVPEYKGKTSNDPDLDHYVEIAQQKVASKPLGPSHTKMHVAGYRSARFGEYEYLCSLNRLVVDEKTKTVSNHIGRLQFSRYKITGSDKSTQINYSANEFKMMYPTTAEDEAGRFDNQSGHCVYNAPLTISSTAFEIAREFGRFIGLWEHADLIRSLKHSSGSCDDLLNAAEQDELLKAIVCWEFKAQSHQ